MTKTAQSYARLFLQGRVNAAGLARAAQRGLMAQDECDTILSQETREADEEESV